MFYHRTLKKSMPTIEVSYVKAIFFKIFEGFELKILAGIAISAFSFLFDKIYADAMLAIVILTAFDFVTGIVAQKKNGIQIESSKVFRSAKKIAIYFVLISAGFLSETATNHVLPIMDETIMGFLAVTELISILENAGHMGYAIPQKLLNQLIKYKNNQ